ncbi:MAG: dTDP-glucose 4,6-dehydratase [Candidatus Liptonbacteria bacterium GWB1_49_6]|uniref:dTDP-glucose 4,6-dehydratase n=1 Tax=Candidatus Liptonbacteria bacterium GWB1_49_6 TaxID=1798644 RepID=A0A1G2C631_9BACT|nr:MAG: dTDP-glucose 4,6-dehydratase [Candidatus Liptonbacteria bacterium GWB1_49_6]
MEQPKKVFVAGGAGFIGSNFIHHLLNTHTDIEVLNYDKLAYAGNLENLRDLESDKRYRFVRGDIVDKKTLRAALDAFRPTHIINFAAETHVDRSIHVGAEAFIQTNIWGPFNFLEYIKDHPTEKYLQVSTDEVYGSLDLKSTERFSEKTAFDPNIPYSATKAGGDLLCKAYFSTWHVPVVVTHCSNNYGSYQYPEKLIPFFIVRMLEGKTLPLYGDGKHVRDWIYVLDHCEALKLCLFGGKAGEVYNIGADNERANVDIARAILRHFGKDDSFLEFVQDRPGHDRRYSVDSSKIRSELGWAPRTSFEEAFSKTIRWYVEHHEWIEDVRKKTGVFNPHIDLWKGHGLAPKG